MEITYKGFKGEKIANDGREIIILAGDDVDSLVWIEGNEIRSSSLELLKETLTRYKMSDADIREEKLHPGLHYYIVDIKAPV